MTGAKDYASVGYNFQMAVILATSVAICPVSVVWAFSKYILMFFGQDEDVSRRASMYLQVMIPSILTFSLRQCLQTWFQVQGIVKPFTVNSAIMAVVSLPLTYICVKKLDFLGGAVATTCITLTQSVLDTSYVFFSGEFISSFGS